MNDRRALKPEFEAHARAYKPSNMALHLAPKEGVNKKATKNLLIEVENLEVLRLLQKAYRGRGKRICIDPPRTIYSS